MHWYNDTRPPRHLTAQSSAMYAGTVPEANPMLNLEPFVRQAEHQSSQLQPPI